MHATTDVTDGVSPLLDRGTQLAHRRFRAKLWPTCREASIVYVGGLDDAREIKAPKPPDEDENTRRSVRRARSTLRRYCVHNGLRFMPTLTYRTEVEGVPRIGEDMRQFRRRLLRTGWFGDVESFPYAWVPEAGSLLGRLHVHIAVEWWGSLGCVEVCERCATPGLRKKRASIPPAGSRCVGCVWGKGFVGAPSEGTGDPRLVAMYASKYVAKGFEEGRLSSQRYRVAEGFSPEPVVVEGRSFGEALGRAVEAMDGEMPKVEALHEVVAGWDAPPAWSLTWEL